MIIKTKNRISYDYIFTLSFQDPNDHELLKELKEKVKAENQRTGLKKRVILRGRKPFKKAVNPWTGRKRSYDLSGNIVGGIKNASEVDVYVY